MRVQAPTTSFAAALVGRAAAEALASEVRFRVQAVFRRSFYCRSDRGALVCVGPPSLGAGPLNALCAIPAELVWGAGALSPGEAAESDGGTLRVANRWAFRFADAAVWRPARLDGPADGTALSAGLARLAQAGGGWPERGGFMPLVARLARGECPASGDPSEPNPLIRMALPDIGRLARWLECALTDARRTPASPFPAAERLLGLGPGLTPSGDDFVGGILVALHSFGHARLAEQLGAGALPLARRRTNAVSYAHLACAAGGEGSAALHGTLETLARPGAPGLERCLGAIDAVGHTSGWDALAGAVLAAAAIAQRGSG